MRKILSILISLSYSSTRKQSKITMFLNRQLDKLRAWGLIKKNSKYDPKQEYIERGYFEVVEGTKESSKGVFTYKTTRVLGKGQVYIINKLIKEQKECVQ